MTKKRSISQSFMLIGATVLLSDSVAAQSGTAASAVAGPLCCTVQSGSDVQGSPNITRATSSSAAASFASPGVGIPHPVLSNASAYADLATGKIGAASYSTDYGYTRAYGAFEDTLAFNITGASATTITPITFNFLYHGTIKPSYGLVSTAFSFSAIQNGGYDGIGNLLVDRTKGSGNDQDRYFSRVQNSGWLGFVAAPDGSGNTYTMSATFGLLGATPILRLSEYLSIYTSQAADADFSNTASLLLSIPDSATFMSASGVFLSQTMAVPESSTWTMMIAGFTLLALTMRIGRGGKAPAVRTAPYLA